MFGSMTESASMHAMNVPVAWVIASLSDAAFPLLCSRSMNLKRESPAICSVIIVLVVSVLPSLTKINSRLGYVTFLREAIVR